MFTRIVTFFRTSFSYVWLIVLAVYFGVLATQSFLRSYQSQQDVSSLQQQLSDAEKQKEKLQALVTYYETDDYKEKQLRSQLLLKMPGEKVYALPESSLSQAQDDVVSSQTHATTVENLPYWQQWAQYLFGGKQS